MLAPPVNDRLFDQTPSLRAQRQYDFLKAQWQKVKRIAVRLVTTQVIPSFPRSPLLSIPGGESSRSQAALHYRRITAAAELRLHVARFVRHLVLECVLV
jgi:hypothetical protein